MNSPSPIPPSRKTGARSRGPGTPVRGLAELIGAHAAQEARIKEAIARGMALRPPPAPLPLAEPGQDPLPRPLAAAPDPASGPMPQAPAAPPPMSPLAATPPRHAAPAAPESSPGFPPQAAPAMPMSSLAATPPQHAAPTAPDPAPGFPPQAAPAPPPKSPAAAAPPQHPAPAGPSRLRGMRRAPPPLFGEFRSMMAPAPPPPGWAATGADAAGTLAQPPVTEIDSEINVLKLQMHMAELEVLDHPPRDMREALLKLRFLGGMFDNGGQVEPGLASALIRECTALLEPAIPSA